MRGSQVMQGSIVCSPSYDHRMCLHPHVNAAKETLMPVKIGSFEPLSEEEFAALRQQKGRIGLSRTEAFLLVSAWGDVRIGQWPRGASHQVL
jgi:hypothetical protein